MFKNAVDFLTGNRILNAAIVAMVIVQTLKVIIYFIKTKKLNFMRFFETGGMPSSHAAFAVSLVTGVWRICGTQSTEFAIAAALAIIVIYDAVGIRRAAGEHAKKLNFIIENMDEVDASRQFEKKLKVLLGHTPLEVFVGSIIGIIIGLVI